MLNIMLRLYFKAIFKTILLLVLAVAMVSSAIAQDMADETGAASISPNRIGLELSNPVTGLRSIATDLEFRTFQGDLPGSEDWSGWKVAFTPSWPIKLGNGKNILLSATFQIFSDQPYYQRGFGGDPDFDFEWGKDYGEDKLRQVPERLFDVGELARGHDHFGDLFVNIGYGGTSERGYIGMVGLAVVAPTSSDTESARRQWAVGPEIVLGRTMNNGQFGVRVKHLKNLESDFPWETNETSAKIFLARSLGNGWLIESNPTILYDWAALDGNEWLVPLGAGISKTFMAGPVPVKMSVELQKYVVSPDRFGPDWFLRFNLTPVLSTKLLN